MTGNDILKEEFERAGMRGGYRADQVDAFLKTVAKYVDDINGKNEDLSYKLKILADKIEEYKKDESSIRDALLGAQKLGASVLDEANQKAEAITRESKNAADEMLMQAKTKIESLTKESLQRANMEIAALKRECEREQRHLDSMKIEVSSFRSSILKQYRTHLDLLSNLPSYEGNQQNPQPEGNISDTAPVEVPADLIKEELREHIRNNTNQLKAVGIRENRPSVPTNGTFSKIVDLKINIPIEHTTVMDKLEVEKETIKTDVTPVDDIKQETRQQTKEFNGGGRRTTVSPSDMNDRGSVSPAVPFNPPKKTGSMASKFAELDFGKNNE